MKIIRERQVVEGVDYTLDFDWAESNGSWFSLHCDENGNVDESQMEPSAIANLHACQSGEVGGCKVKPGKVRTDRWRRIEPTVAECDVCGGEATMACGCGAYVCEECGNHPGLARCFCGWSQSGGDGCDELVEMGETIEPDGDW